MYTSVVTGKTSHKSTILTPALVMTLTVHFSGETTSRLLISATHLRNVAKPSSSVAVGEWYLQKIDVKQSLFDVSWNGKVAYRSNKLIAK